MRALISSLLLTGLLLSATESFAAKKKKNDTTTVVVVADSLIIKKDSVKTPGKLLKAYKETIDKCKEFSGLFNIYQDTTTGKVYLEITEDKLGQEFIYFCHAMDGPLDGGYIRGGYRDNSIFKIEKYYDRIDFKLQNTNFYFDPNNALSKAAEANINSPLFLSEKIVGVSDTGKSKSKSYLIDADPLFLAENITQIKPSKQPGDKGDGFTLGTLSAKKTKYIWVKDFPMNSDVAVEYVYENPLPVNYGGDEVTDARFISIKLQHTLLAMPKDDFKPRFDDPRVGYFIEKVNDQTTTNAVPWRDLIHHWNLQKKDPNAAISEPVTPIVWWIEKTTPKEFRPIIKSAVLKWNEAFEAAGFKNVVQVFEQPDTASWEAEDIRYNVLRWTSSPRPPYGGYGPHFVNPRTGEILSADIMLELVYMTNRYNIEKLFEEAGLEKMEKSSNGNFCMMGDVMHDNILAGMQVMNAFGFSEIDKGRFLKEALYDLTLHEVGHTLGLNHNFIASTINSFDQMQDTVLGNTKGLTASVMDYTIPNISPDKNKQGLFFDVKPGPYDIWAIQYGYTQYKNAGEEKKGLEELLKKSTQPEYRFMNDGDDMRSPGDGIDPRAMIYDLSSDPISYAITNTDLVKQTFGKLLGKYNKPDQSYQELRNAYLILSTSYNRNMNTISRYIGGVYVDRSFVGQNSMNKPLTPVPYTDQKRAMDALKKYCFAPNAFDEQTQLGNYLEVQRRGYLKENEDPKMHERLLNMQKSILDQLLHPATLQRITDTKLYGNTYSLNGVLKDLTDNIFSADLTTEVNSVRQNLQGEYVNRLIKIADPKNSGYSFLAKSASYAQLQQIKKWMLAYRGTDASTQSHRSYLVALIDKAMKEN